MDSNEVMKIAKDLDISNFLGVFAADQLCTIEENQVGTLIVNTDPFHLEGQHWISFCLGDKDIYLYDSLCLDVYKTKYFSKFLIHMNKNLHYNIIRTQSAKSIMCGYHALVFCYVMKMGGGEQIFRSFLETFKPYNVINREQLSLTYFTIARKNE